MESGNARRALWEAGGREKMLSLSMGLHQPHDSNLRRGDRGRLYNLQDGLSGKKGASEIILTDVPVYRSRS